MLPLVGRTVPDPDTTVPLLVEPLPTLVEPLPGPPPFDPLGAPVLLCELPLEAELPLVPPGVTVVGVPPLHAALTTRAAHGPAWSQSLCFIVNRLAGQPPNREEKLAQTVIERLLR